ncbi:MAG: RBBP9/YdeN family alpha/beta hydrolase [Candidatus Levyibacteriota bacterium]
MNTKVILIHGSMGNTQENFWLPYVANELRKLGLTVIAKTFPDNKLARAKYWLPYIDALGADENTILIGHSSGAIAAMRYAENHKILGSVLVSTYCTDLNDAEEKLSGYFNHPWNWEKIKENQKWVVQFASIDDPWIPIEEARLIHEKLGSKYFEYASEGHFGFPKEKKEFPEIVEEVKKALQMNAS